MSIRSALAGLAFAAAALAISPVSAQTPVDFTPFTAACMGAQDFLLAGLPEGIAPESVLTPLCGCMATEFKEFNQADVDMLSADLRGESTEATKTAYGDYAALSTKAEAGFVKCQASDEVQKALTPPADPMAPAAPAAQ